MASVMDEALAEMRETVGDVHREPARGLDLQVDLARTMQKLLWIVTVLIGTGTVANSVSHQLAPSPEHKIVKLMNRFDIGFEPSLPNWYSSMTLLAASVLLALIGLSRNRLRQRFSFHWFVLAVLFLGLSIDEGVRFHEMIHTVIVSRMDVHGIFYFPWVVPALIFVGIVGLSYVPFLKNLDRRTAFYFVSAGAIYVLGAVGMDMAGGVVVEQFGMDSFSHTMTQLFEELFEMLGVVLFLYALLDYIRCFVGPVSIRITSTQPSRSANSIGLGI